MNKRYKQLGIYSIVIDSLLQPHVQLLVKNLKRVAHKVSSCSLQLPSITTRTFIISLLGEMSAGEHHGNGDPH